MMDLWEDWVKVLQNNYQPRNQVVLRVSHNIFALLGDMPLTVLIIVGLVVYAVACIVAFPLLVGTMAILFVLDVIAMPVEFIYLILKRWTLIMWRGISGHRKDLSSEQLPTTNNPLIISAPIISPTSTPDSTVFIRTVPDKEYCLLHKTPATIASYNPVDFALALTLPPPCTQIGARSRENDYQSTIDPPPPYR
jgi:hypothetical protein